MAQRRGLTESYISPSPQAGASSGDVVDYSILDPVNGASEIGTGTYTSAGLTLTRSVTKSTNANAAITASAASIVRISPRAESLITLIGKQVFAASGTYTPTPGMLYCVVECWGGGGGGGGCQSQTTATASAAGGGSGGYSRIIATAATVGASQTATVGAGGTGAATGAASGGAGGDTSIGTLCVGKGGTGGAPAAGAGVGGNGGGGGVAGTGDLVIPGRPGGIGASASTSATVVAINACGGSSIYGGGVSIPFNASGSASAGGTAAAMRLLVLEAAVQVA